MSVTRGHVAGSQRKTIENLRGTVVAMDIEAHADRDEIRRLREANAGLAATVHDLGVQLEESGKEERALRAEVERLRAGGGG